MENGGNGHGVACRLLYSYDGAQHETQRCPVMTGVINEPANMHRKHSVVGSSPAIVFHGTAPESHKADEIRKLGRRTVAN